MEQKEGLKNFAVNIKPIMERIRDKKSLSTSQLQSILQFYIEVVNFISK